MRTVPEASGEIKAPSYSRTRAWAGELAANRSIRGRDHFALVEIASRPDELTAADAWTVRRIAEQVGRTAS